MNKGEMELFEKRLKSKINCVCSLLRHLASSHFKEQEYLVHVDISLIAISTACSFAMLLYGANNLGGFREEHSGTDLVFLLNAGVGRVVCR